MKLNPKAPMLIVSVCALVVAVVCAIVLVRDRLGPASGAAGEQAGVTASGKPIAYDGQASAAQAVESSEPGWPRKITSGDTTVLFYHPQIEKWQGDQIQGYTAVSIQTSGSDQQTYGKVYFTTHAVADNASRQVTLDRFKVTSGDFPTASDKASEYLSIIQQAEGNRVETVPEDQLRSDLAFAEAERKTGSELKNDPPRIIFSTRPAVLVLIDGQPVLRPVGQDDLQRVINTRALILFDQKNNTYYLSLMNGWVESPSPEGPWTPAGRVPATANRIRASLASNSEVDLLNGDHKVEANQAGAGGRSRHERRVGTNHAESLSARLKDGTFPTVYVSTVPAELLTAEGDPQLKPIPNTGLLYVANSGDQIFLNTANRDYYVLISGRWFEARSMEGPWQYVDGRDLPSDFAKIPEGDPKASVLASTPGTPAAQEAAIANQIPQTATINRQQAQLTVNYDGDPRFDPIPGTHLQSATNSATPVIEVAPNNFLAVQDGVWFTSTSALGPWAVATSVPTEVYTIPTSSRVHNVIYTRIYGYTDDVVYTGYTPGYYGTVLEPDGSIAYGTGFYYPPYIGSTWIGWPWTYGFGAGFGWSPLVGWGFGFGQGFLSPFYAPWWTPFGFGWGSPVFGFGFPVLGFGGGFPVWGFPVAQFGFGFPVWRFGWGGRFDWDDRFGRFGSGGFRAFNVFDRWGRSALVANHAGWTGGRFAGNAVRPALGNRAGFAGNPRTGFRNSGMGMAGGAARAAGSPKMGGLGGMRAGRAANSRMGAAAGARAGSMGNSRMGAAGSSRMRAAGNSRQSMPGNSRGAFPASRGRLGASRGNAFAGSRGASGAPRMNGLSASRGGASARPRGGFSSPRMGGFGGSGGGFSAPRMSGGSGARGGGAFAAQRAGGMGGFGGRGGGGGFAGHGGGGGGSAGHGGGGGRHR